MNLVLLALGLALAGPSTAPADTSVVARALALCTGIESIGRAEDFRALGAGAEAALIAIAGDDTLLPTQRANALSALAHVPGAAGRAHLLATLADRDAMSLLRRKAALALGRGWGSEARAVLESWALDPDEQVRISVERALAAAGAQP
jgi:hypothetical protein